MKETNEVMTGEVDFKKKDYNGVEFVEGDEREYVICIVE